MLVNTLCSLPSSNRNVFSDDYLEIRGNIIRALQCCIVFRPRKNLTVRSILTVIMLTDCNEQGDLP